MKKAISVAIHEPCHENWQRMTPSQQGRFCASCQKEVVDFTSMTDAEVYSFFTARSAGSNVCGRMLESQLGNPIAKPTEHKKKKFWYLAYLTSLLLLIKPGAKAQTNQPTTETVPVLPRPELQGKIAVSVTPQTTPAKRVYYGKVFYNNNEPIPHASVVIKGTRTGVSADREGLFSISAKPGDVLQVSAAGFKVKEVVLTPAHNKLNILLSTDDRVIMGAMVMVEPVKVKKQTNYPVTALEVVVTDKKTGLPVPAANVSVTGAQNTRQANETGHVQLLVSDNAELRVSHVGYRDTVVAVRGHAGSLAIQLTSLAQTMEEVVVTAAVTGKIRRYTTGGVTVVGAGSMPQKPSVLSRLAATLTGNNAIRIYPNPVERNAALQIQFRNVSKGAYQLQLVSMAGTMVQGANIQVPASQFLFQWLINGSIAAGTYQVHVIGTAGKLLYHTKVVIL